MKLTPLAALTLAGLLLVGPARAQEDAAPALTVQAAGVVSGDEVSLQDGRVLRLSGIKAVIPAAADYLKKEIVGHALQLSDAVDDRYGRVAAIATTQDGSVQEAMLRRGLAYVYPATGDADTLDALLSAERQARQAKAGYWATQGFGPSTEAAQHCGSYALIEGAVTSAERIRNKVYVTFGAKEHPDMTVVIAARYLRTLKKNGLDVAAMAGQRVRVRGWLSRGAVITLSDAHQIELSGGGYRDGASSH